MTDSKASSMKAHWAKTRSLTFFVLAIWFVFSFVVHWFADALNSMSFIGFPLGFYMAAQGSLIVFVVLIFFLTKKQEKIDEEFGFAEDDDK